MNFLKALFNRGTPVKAKENPCLVCGVNVAETKYCIEHRCSSPDCVESTLVLSDNGMRHYLCRLHTDLKYQHQL